MNYADEYYQNFKNFAKKAFQAFILKKNPTDSTFP